MFWLPPRIRQTENRAKSGLEIVRQRDHSEVSDLRRQASQSLYESRKRLRKHLHTLPEGSKEAESIRCYLIYGV